MHRLLEEVRVSVLVGLSVIARRIARLLPCEVKGDDGHIESVPTADRGTRQLQARHAVDLLLGGIREQAEDLVVPSRGVRLEAPKRADDDAEAKVRLSVDGDRI